MIDERICEFAAAGSIVARDYVKSRAAWSNLASSCTEYNEGATFIPRCQKSSIISLLTVAFREKVDH